MEKITYKAVDTLKWWSQFEGKTVLIKTKTKEFEIPINNNMVAHLLGLHYMKLDQPLSGARLFYYTLEHELSDQEVLRLVSRQSFYRSNDVANRINYFKEFMEHLESGIVVENTHPTTNIKSTHFIVQSKDKYYMQLALMETTNQDVVVDFYVDTTLSTYFETFIVRSNADYFKESKENYQIQGIYELEGLEEIPFSFSVSKNNSYEVEEDLSL